MRLQSLGAPVMAGMGLGSLLWLALGHGFTGQADLQAINARLKSPAPRAAFADGTDRLARAALQKAPFDPPAPLPTLRLIGLSRTPTRSAALIEVAGKPAQWISVGATRDGFTLVAVAAGKAMIDTSDGPATLVLGRILDPSAPKLSAPAVGAVAEDQQTTGFKMPPAPADAPRP